MIYIHVSILIIILSEDKEAKWSDEISVKEDQGKGGDI